MSVGADGVYLSVSPRLEELERNETGRRRLARLLAVDYRLGEGHRMLIVNALFRRIATKDNLLWFGERIEGGSRGLRARTCS